VEILGFIEDVWWGFRNDINYEGLILFSKMEECEEELKVNGITCVPSYRIPFSV